MCIRDRKLTAPKAIKVFALVISLGCFVALIYLMLVQSGSVQNDLAPDQYIIPVTLLMLWSMLLAVMVMLFPHMPDKASASDGFFRRTKVWIQRVLYYGLGFSFIGISLVALMLSLKMMGIWQEDFYIE